MIFFKLQCWLVLRGEAVNRNTFGAKHVLKTQLPVESAKPEAVPPPLLKRHLQVLKIYCHQTETFSW
jgi:hypothetical protein